MAIPVANLTPFIPTVAPDAPATGPAQTRTTGDASPFQAVLATATQAQQPAATADANATAATDATAAADKVASDKVAADADVLDAELAAQLEADAEAAALAADSALAGLLGFVTQTLSPPENAAVAQATGQSEELLTATVTTDIQSQTSVDITTTDRTRADQLRLDRGNGPLSTTTLLAPTNGTAPSATTPPPVPATPTGTNALLTNSAAIGNAVPIVTDDQTATAAASVARTATTAAPRGGSSIPAQAPLLTNLIPPVPVPANLSVESPPVTEPTAAVAAAALPSAQLGSRPATAGEQFVADAAAGARLAAAAPGSAEFANVLAPEVTGPQAATAPVPETVPTVRIGAPNTAEPLLPIVAAATVTTEADPVATFDRAIADIARAVARPAGAVPLATEVTVNRLALDTALPPVQPAQREEPVRPADDSTSAGAASGASAVASSSLPAPAVARSAVSETNAVRPTPAAQISDTIVTHAQVLERHGGVEFQMRLDPPELGRLQIRLMTRGDQVHGHVLVANEAVRGLIESQLPELRQRLEAAGVNVQQFNVSTDPNGGGGRGQYRDAVSEFAPRSASPVVSVPRARVGRTDPGSLDVTV